jgi:hypothetical protein
LWPVGGTYGGSGVFLDNRTLMIGACALKHTRIILLAPCA